MRRKAGSFAQRKLINSSLLAIGGVGMAMGLGIGLLFYPLFPPWADSYWGVFAYLGTAGVSLSPVCLMTRPSFRWNLDNLQKGGEAETYVGQLVEYAITAEHCAVAHSVTEIATGGDIDHLVATPAAVWLIETKYKRVPNLLSWQVEGGEYDTLYEVEISNVTLRSRETRRYSYPVFIDRANIEY